MKFFRRGMTVWAGLLAAVLLVGCESDNSYRYDPLGATAGTNAPSAPAVSADPTGTLLHIGDEITISFADMPADIKPIDDTIKEDGSVTLIYNQKFQVAGKTIGALQTEIRDRYVPQYFKFLTVSIAIQSRFFSVGGEVRSPSRQVYQGKMTILGAIDSVGGFTDFANKKKIRVTRSNGENITVNYFKAQENADKNIEVYPGDLIYVPKRLW